MGRDEAPGIDKGKYDNGVTLIDAGSPIALMLKEMAHASNDDTERPEIACMLLEVSAYEKHTC